MPTPPTDLDDLHALVDALPPLTDDQCEAIGDLLVQIRVTP